jgi:hypothetical protein
LLRLPGFELPDYRGGRSVYERWFESLNVEESQILDYFIYGLDEGVTAEQLAKAYELSRSGKEVAVMPQDSLLNHVKQVLATSGQREEQGENYTGEALIRDSKQHDALGKLVRYENSHRNAIARGLNQLCLLQSMRRAVAGST